MYFLSKDNYKIIFVEKINEPYLQGYIYASKCCETSIGSFSKYWSLEDYIDITENFQKYVEHFKYKLYEDKNY